MGAGLLLAMLAVVAWVPETKVGGLLPVLLTVPFVGVVAVRCLALWTVARGVASDAEMVAAADEDLPAYTVLVPMFCETAVAAQLVRNLRAIDYPVPKLQVLLITEQEDTATRIGLNRAGLAENMRIVVVPDGLPRTKPRALNYALREAEGDYVVVYDAEDEPEADQLRRAVSAFAQGSGRIGCLQGHLKIYNTSQSWLTRQFAIEYAALFALILPAFERFGLPITLGGTSNHFPRRVLEEVGGWDAHNVTEDADLGIRLARFGWHVGVLRSATWEEAPATLRDWWRQRMRWLKGWLQTAIVHMRQPRRLWRDLGAVRCLSLQLLFASMLLSAFVHPIYLATLGHALLTGTIPGREDGASIVWWAGLAVFVAGYAVSLAVAGVAAVRSDHDHLLRSVWLMPVYWLMISAAAYGALWEYAVRPFHWNKTPHTGRKNFSGAPAAQRRDFESVRS